MKEPRARTGVSVVSLDDVKEWATDCVTKDLPCKYLQAFIIDKPSPKPKVLSPNCIVNQSPFKFDSILDIDIRVDERNLTPSQRSSLNSALGRNDYFLGI